MAYKMLVMAGVEYELECDGGNVLIKWRCRWMWRGQWQLRAAMRQQRWIVRMSLRRWIRLTWRRADVHGNKHNGGCCDTFDADCVQSHATNFVYQRQREWLPRLLRSFGQNRKEDEESRGENQRHEYGNQIIQFRIRTPRTGRTLWTRWPSRTQRIPRSVHSSQPK